MKSFVFAPCILDTPYRVERNIKWLDYYEPLLPKLGAECIWLVDNASDWDTLKSLGGSIYSPKMELLQPATDRPFLNVVHYEQRLERVRFKVYHYWWRAMFTGWQTIPEKFGYKKAIHIDTDVFVLSAKLAEHIKNTNSGWSAFYCPRHDFPDSTFTVLCKDRYDISDAFIGGSFPIEKYDDKDAEHIIPFTNVIKEFSGDRFGERGLPQTPFMDYYGQCPNEIEMRFI